MTFYKLIEVLIYKLYIKFETQIKNNNLDILNKDMERALFGIYKH